MFNKKTVFVVGAGASAEVGLPIGDQLAVDISEKLKQKDPRTLRPTDDILYHLIRKLAQDAGEPNAAPWFQIADDLAQAVVLAPSIDNYLHTHYHDTRRVKIGKLAIARCILEAENKSRLATDPGSQFDFADLHAGYRRDGSSPSWHNVFFKLLIEGAQKSSLEDLFRNTVFICFNYDRCIEHYLAHALTRYMNLHPLEARRLVSTLEIIHPYGRVGELLDRTPDFVEFGGESYSNNLIEISRQIRTFTEQVADDIPERIRVHLDSATAIVFLGFSFGEMNLDLFRLKGDRGYKQVIATGYRTSKSNCSYIETRLRDLLCLESAINNMHIHIEDMTCHDLLSAYYRMLQN